MIMAIVRDASCSTGLEAFAINLPNALNSSANRSAASWEVSPGNREGGGVGGNSPVLWISASPASTTVGLRRFRDGM